MKFNPYTIVDIQSEAKETFILRVSPKNKGLVSFNPGQYTHIINPAFQPEKEHSFSIACPPQKHNGDLEYCIKIYGEWTKQLSKKSPGDELFIAGPCGNFVFDQTKDTNAVFLVGGVGIAPIMSMLRFIQQEKITGNFLLIYGSRTEEYIAYKKELELLERSITKLKVIHILSDVPSESTWKGYTGFITKEILEKEINFSLHPTFFIIGPGIFIAKTEKLLTDCAVSYEDIKTEQL